MIALDILTDGFFAAVAGIGFGAGPQCIHDDVQHTALSGDDSAD